MALVSRPRGCVGQERSCWGKVENLGVQGTTGNEGSGQGQRRSGCLLAWRSLGEEKGKIGVFAVEEGDDGAGCAGYA